jgi:hypothetical protein
MGLDRKAAPYEPLVGSDASPLPSCDVFTKSMRKSRAAFETRSVSNSAVNLVPCATTTRCPLALESAKPMEWLSLSYRGKPGTACLDGAVHPISKGPDMTRRPASGECRLLARRRRAEVDVKLLLLQIVTTKVASGKESASLCT